MKDRIQVLLINILMFIALVILLGMGIGSYLQIQKLKNDNAWVAHTYQVIGQTRLTLIHFLHADLLAHDYIANHNPKDLTDLQNSFKFVNNALEKVSMFVTDNPKQIENVNHIKVLVAQKEQELIDMTQHNTSLNTAAINKNTQITQTVVNSMESIISEEINLLQLRNAKSQEDANRASFIVTFASLISILLLGSSFALINYHLSERKRTRAQLKDTEAKLKKMIDGSRDLIAAVDTDLNYIAFNSAYEKKYHELFNKKLMLGMSIHDIVVNELQSEEIISAWNRAVHGDEIIMVDRWKSKSNQSKDDHYYEIAFNPIFDNNNNIIGAMNVMRDITERMKVDQLKNEFVSIVSHELRTPLTSIRGALGLLVGGAIGDFDDKTQKMLQIAFNNSERLIRLINDILDISKIENNTIDFQLVPVDLHKVIEEAIIGAQHFAEKFSVKIHLNKSPNMIFVYADYGRLMQVITNLISNAVKFSPPHDEVLINVSLDSNTVRVSVTDHGEGIPEEFQKQIFQKFAQAESSLTRKQSGTGLGLSISKAIIEKLSGSIDFTTEAGNGTTFYFDLPVWLESRDDGETTLKSITNTSTSTMMQEAEPKTKNLKVLYVEDDPDLTEIVCKLLEDEANIENVQTTNKAIEAIAKQKFDLVLLDLVLPDGYGANLIPELTKQKIPIVIFSAYDLPQKYVPYVVKALVKSQTTNQELVQTIRRAMKRPTTGKT